MNLDRFTEIVESYGANPAHWPVDERASALAFSATEAATQMMAQADTLDQQLATFDLPDDAIAVTRIQQRVLAATQPSMLDRILAWIAPDIENLLQTIWRPALAGSLPLIIGIVIGLSTPADDGYDLSTDEELSLLAFSNSEVLFDE